MGASRFGVSSGPTLVAPGERAARKQQGDPSVLRAALRVWPAEARRASITGVSRTVIRMGWHPLGLSGWGNELSANGRKRLKEIVRRFAGLADRLAGF